MECTLYFSQFLEVIFVLFTIFRSNVCSLVLIMSRKIDVHADEEPNHTKETEVISVRDSGSVG
jgi:hypothetical protein